MNGPRYHGRAPPNMMGGRQGRGHPPMMRGGGRFPPGGGRMNHAMMGGPPPPIVHHLPPPPPPIPGSMMGRFQGRPPVFPHGPGRMPHHGGRGPGPGMPSAPFQQQHANNPNFRQAPPPQQPGANFLAQQQRRHSAPVISASQAQIDQAWTSYTPPMGGRTFYYNSIMKTSVYEKPAALAAGTPPTNTAWKEYLDAKTGKKYYSNGTTTTWDIPPELSSAPVTAAAPANPAAAPIVASSEPDPPPKKKRKMVEHNFGSKEESIAAFKGLLLSKEVLPTAKWNDIIKMCQCPRWDACEAALTVGERKQALAEYQTKRANELRALERQEKVRAKDTFMELLTELIPSAKGFSAWSSRWKDMRDYLTKDDRFHTVATEDARESLFVDFCEEFKKREERRKRSKKKEAEENFTTFLVEKEDEGKLSFASTWGSFVSSLSRCDEEDPRFLPSTFLADADRQLYFADYVISLQTAEDDKRNRIRGARKRAEKAQREEFGNGLRDLALEGKLLPSSRWEGAREAITVLKAYGPIRTQDPGLPRQIFEEFVTTWVESYRRDRAVLIQMLPSNMEFNAETSYDEFVAAIIRNARKLSPELLETATAVINAAEPVSNAKIYLKELTGSLTVEQTKRRPSSHGKAYDSSEDEGEIVEDED